MDGFVDRLHALRFLRACDPSYGALTFTLVGLPPTGYISLLLDILFGSFLPSLWSSTTTVYSGRGSRHCYAIKWIFRRSDVDVQNFRAVLTSLSVGMYTPLLAMLKSASGAHTMPSLNRLTALATSLALSLAPFAAAAAQERTQEKETKTVEKEKPAEPTPPPPKEESSVTEHSIKIGGQNIPYKAVTRTPLLQKEKNRPP